MPAEIWVVIQKDRHFGVEVSAFSTWDAANAELESVLEDNRRYEAEFEYFGDEIERGVTYSCEGDFVEIVKRELDFVESWVVNAVLDPGESPRRYVWATEEAAHQHSLALARMRHYPASDVRYRREWTGPWSGVEVQ